jgi:hypothetical protein
VPAIVEASAAVASGAERERLLIVADELLPADYVSLQIGPNIPFALAIVLSSVSVPGAICLNPADPWALAPTSCVGDEGPSVPEPLRFLRSVLVPAGCRMLKPIRFVWFTFGKSLSYFLFVVGAIVLVTAVYPTICLFVHPAQRARRALRHSTSATFRLSICSCGRWA